MRPTRPLMMLAAVLVAGGILHAAIQPHDVVLQPGDVAPDFSLPGTDGRTYTLAEFRNVRPVVIAWFPKAMAKV